MGKPETSQPSLFTPPAGYDLESQLHLELVPKVQKRDSKISQCVLFYRTAETTGSDHDSESVEKGLVILIPNVKTREEIPFYHPDVRKLAFHYEALPPAVEAAEVDEQAPVGVISISVLPWQEASAPGPFENLQAPKKPARRRSPLAGPSVTSDADGPHDESIRPAAVILDQADDLEDSLSSLSQTSKQSREQQQPNVSALPDRLYKTCLALLDRLHKHGFGNSVGYKKRREHDVSLRRQPHPDTQVLVDKSNFQDLYLLLKERHKHLDSQVPGQSKILDLKRHVFKVRS